jgi:hypothetical protein
MRRGPSGKHTGYHYLMDNSRKLKGSMYYSLLQTLFTTFLSITECDVEIQKSSAIHT